MCTRASIPQRATFRFQPQPGMVELIDSLGICGAVRELSRWERVTLSYGSALRGVVFYLCATSQPLVLNIFIG